MVSERKELSKAVSDYIDTLPDWSRKCCEKLREIILNADDSIEEDWKWGLHYKSNGMVCGYGAFQKHINFTFFNGSAMKDPKGLFNHCVDNEFSRSIKFTDVNEIKEKELTAYIKESVAVNKKGFKREVKNKEVIVPDELQTALEKNKPAKHFFDTLSNGYKKEFVELITTAKQEATRQARIAKVVDCCAAGKKLNDKYK